MLNMSDSEEPRTLPGRKTLGELVRFGIVGIAHNLLGYLVYLLITWLGTDPKVAVAILYPLGTAFSFFANRHWTFAHKGQVGESMARYIAMHLFGYSVNLLIIYIGVDLMAIPHQLVQLFAMGFLAVMFFIMAKFLVFTGTLPGSGQAAGRAAGEKSGN